MNILIGGAWPYANGSLHIGHIAALLPGDVLARYHRFKGDNVCYVSGSDCHGTPIMLKAKQENKTYAEVYEHYHQEFCECFERLGFSYDYYGKTADEGHKSFVRKFHKKMYKSESVTEKASEQAYCDACAQFLPDRFVIGTCPKCGSGARGDQCEHCGGVFDSAELAGPTCAVCGGGVSLKETTHLYLRLKDFEAEILHGVDPEKWRKNAVDFTRRYVREGLPERALTRDMELGIEVPKDGYEGKKIYIWAENVLGYLSSCYLSGQSFEGYYTNKDSFHYYVHGKDNIPFHSVILPALLLAADEEYHLPDAIVSSEFMTLDGKKISTSANHAVWIKDLIEKYNPDTIRYFFISNSPEKRDADFTFNEFINNNNGELVGHYGNFVNRTLVFVEKYFGSEIPEGHYNNGILGGLDALFAKTGAYIEAAAFKDALAGIFEYVRGANKYYDSEKPWATRLESPESCADTIYNCVQIAANLSILLAPFLPFSSARLQDWLGISGGWRPVTVPFGHKIPKTEILFKRIV